MWDANQWQEFFNGHSSNFDNLAAALTRGEIADSDAIVESLVRLQAGTVLRVAMENTYTMVRLMGRMIGEKTVFPIGGKPS